MVPALCAYTVPSASTVAISLSSPAGLYQMACWLAFAGVTLVVICVEVPALMVIVQIPSSFALSGVPVKPLPDRAKGVSRIPVALIPGTAAEIDQGLLSGEHGAVGTGRFHGQRGGSCIILAFDDDGTTRSSLAGGFSAHGAVIPVCEHECVRVRQGPGDRLEITAICFARGGVWVAAGLRL